jgi:hypothetical protein
MYIHGFSLDCASDLVGNRILSNRSHVPRKSVAIGCNRSLVWGVAVVTSFLRVAPGGTSTSCIALISPPRILARPATSVSFVLTGRDGKQPDATPLTAAPDIVFEFEGVD